MKYVKLKDVCEIKKGESITRQGVIDGDIPVVAGGQKPSYYHNFANREAGIITVSASGAYAGFINYWDRPIFASDCTTIKPIYDNLNAKYLYIVLKSMQTDFYKLQRGAGQPHVYGKDFENIEIPLPPLETQKKIADVLDKAQELIDKRKEQIEKLDEFVKSVFIDLVGPGSHHYGSWEVVKISDIVLPGKNSIRTGPFGSDLLHSEFVSEGIRVLGIDNVVENRFCWKKQRFITQEKYDKLKRYTVFPEDVIITIMGTTGRSAVVPKDITTAISTKHLAVLTLDRMRVNPYFLSFCIHSHPFVLAQINLKNSGAIMDGLNLGKIKTLKIPLPPLGLQSKFAQIVEKTEQQKSLMQQSLIEMENNFNSLMQRAFRGELF